jgi:hypothetical protein
VLTSCRSLRAGGGFLLILAGSLLASSCAKDDVANAFAGGTSSKDKQPIPSTVAEAPASAAPAANPAPGQPVPAAVITEPVVASKLEEMHLVEGQPIREQAMKYRSTDVRDPFHSLIGDDGSRSDLVDLSVVSLVGIVLGEDPFCIVEDAEGFVFVLRKGDAVKHGRIVAINADTVVASQTLLGYTTTVQLKLLQEENESHG